MNKTIKSFSVAALFATLSFIVVGGLYWYWFINGHESKVEEVKSGDNFDYEAKGDNSIDGNDKLLKISDNELTTSVVESRETDSFDNESLGDLHKGGWEPFVDSGSASFTIVNEGRSNTKALKVELYEVDGSNYWDIQVVREDRTVTPHNIYIYSAWVKGTKGAEVAFAVESSEYLNLNNKRKILSGEWQQVAFEFESESDKVRTPIHFSSPHNTGAVVLVDDIAIEPLTIN